MGVFNGLPNTKGEREAYTVHSITGALKALREGHCCIAADDYGSISFWRDDDGQIRGEFHRWQVTHDSSILPTMKDAKAWLKKWWPAMSSKENPQ